MDWFLCMHDTAVPFQSVDTESFRKNFRRYEILFSGSSAEELLPFETLEAEFRYCSRQKSAGYFTAPTTGT